MDETVIRFPNRSASVDWPDAQQNGAASPRSQRNIEAFLEHVGARLSFNTLSHRYIVTRSGRQRLLDDAVANSLWLEADRLRLHAQNEFFIRVLEDIARRSPFHPVSDYLDGLKWDGKPRLDRWLTTYFGAADTPLHRAFGRIHMIASVRRVRQPGVKYDAMLVLEGPQGAGKSSGIAALCPDGELFTDSLVVGADQKEVIEITEGKWIVEFAELDGMGKSDASTIKAMLSRRIDSARLSYGRYRTERPRQFTLWGTVNDEEYLRDTTGNRRFWPVKIGSIDPLRLVPRITADRDQLWAEAAHFEALGGSITLPPELWDEAATSQNKRRLSNPWRDILEGAISGRNGGITMDAIYNRLGVQTEKRDPTVSQRIASIMRELGFTKMRLTLPNGARPYGYARNYEQCPRIISDLDGGSSY
jgi:predicted P-loop ATPase